MLAARILAVLGVLLAVLSLLAGYIRFQGLDTETVTETAGDLIADEEIRDQVAASLVDALYANIDVTAALEERLPPDQKGLAGPAAAGLREFSERAATSDARAPARAGALGEHRHAGAHAADQRPRRRRRPVEHRERRRRARPPAARDPAGGAGGDRRRRRRETRSRRRPGRDHAGGPARDRPGPDADPEVPRHAGSGSCPSPSGRSLCGSPAAVGARSCGRSRSGRSWPGWSCWWCAASAARTSSTRSCRRRPCSRRPMTPGTS